MPGLDHLLDRFARDPQPDRFLFAPMFTTSGAAVAAKDSRFASGIEQISKQLINNGPNRVFLLAFAWRLTSVTSMKVHRAKIIRALSSGIPALSELPNVLVDPDDRRHLADALQVFKAPWLAEYAARAIVSERDGEKARARLARALIRATPTISEQIHLLGRAIGDVAFDQAEPAVGRARRVALVLDALSEAVWTDDNADPDMAFGKALAGFVELSLLRPSHADRNVTLTAASAVLNYLTTVVRLHGPMAANAETYAVLSPLRRLFGGSDWPDKVAEILKRATRPVVEQLVFLSRLGKPDSALRNVVILMLGNVVGQRVLAKAADQSELEPDAAHWLRTGTARRAIANKEAIEDLALSTIDAELAAAFRNAELIEHATVALSNELMALVEYERPQLRAELSALLRRTTAVALNVKAAARRRGFALRGQIGEIVEFSPLEHLAEGEVVGARTVRLRNRAVERRVDGRALGIVLKADVDLVE